MDRMQAPVIGRLMTGAFLKFLPDNLDISRFLATPLRSATWQSCKNSFGPGIRIPAPRLPCCKYHGLRHSSLLENRGSVRKPIR